MGRAIRHTCCQVAWPTASCTLTSSLHPTPSESLPSRPSPPEEPTAFQPSGVTFKKKTPNHKANKRPVRRRAKARGVPVAPLQAVPEQTPPRPCLVAVPQVSPNPPPHPPSRYQPDAYTTATWGSGPTYCAGAGNSPADGRLTKYNSAHNSSRASRPRPSGQLPAASRGLESSPPALGRVAGGRVRAVSCPQKRSGAGRRTRF